MGDRARNKSTPTRRSSVRKLNNYKLQDTTLSERRGERKQYISDRKIRKHWREMTIEEREALTGLSILRGREIVVKMLRCYKEHGNCPCNKRGVDCPASIPRNRNNSSHFWDKYEQERLTLKNSNLNPEEMNLENILRVLVNPYQIVEYNYDLGNQTSRVLLRGKNGVCVVLDLNQIKIVTTYFNSRNDQHSTLRPTDYVNNLQPSGFLGKLYDRGIEKYHQLVTDDKFHPPVAITAPVEKIGEHQTTNYIRERFQYNGAEVPADISRILN